MTEKNVTLHSIKPELSLNISPKPPTITDLELLKLLCSSDQDEDLFREFSRRFWPDLLEECKDICKKRKIDSQIGAEIAHETLERVRKYKSFHEDGIRLPDERKAILVYLFRIANRQFNTYYSKQNREEQVHKSYFDDIQNNFNGSIDTSDLEYKKEIATKILKKLNPKEREVFLVDMEYKRHQKYLPDDVLELLSEKLKVKKDSVRKIRERAIAKIKKAIDEINQD